MTSQYHPRRTGVFAALLAGCLVGPAAAQASAAAPACGQGVRVASSGAGLRELLEELATTLRFDLQYWATDNPRVRVQGRHATLDLVRLLSQDANMVVRYRPDRACKGEWKIASIWVVSAGVAAAGTSAPAMRAAPPVTAPAPPVNANGEGNEEHLRAHGLLPEASKP